MMTPKKTRFLVAAALSGSMLAAAALTLSACGKMGSLETAPPLYGAKAKAQWSANHSGDTLSSSSSSLSGGGNQATLEPTADTPKETEKALPDANGKNKMANPYTANVTPSQAPIEGTGNAEGH
ncbi:MAG: hypothetical protein ACXU8U_03300 [Asticcacaulis sp.]